jgi:hypothetical protein
MSGDKSQTQFYLGEPSYDPRAHYERISERFRSHPLNDYELARTHTLQLIKRVLKASVSGRLPNEAILNALQDIVVDLLVDNHIYVEPPPEYASTHADRNILTVLEHCYDASRIEPATEILEAVLTRLLAVLPSNAFTNIDGTSCPLIDFYPEPATFISYAVGTLSTATDKTGKRLFTSLYAASQQNIAEVSGCSIERIDTAKLTWPEQSSLSGESLANAYLKNTPLLSFFLAPIVFQIPHKTRFEHTYIVGGAGAGKTTLIQQMVLEDLAQEDPPAMVIIDPKGLMVDRISKLNVFNGRLKDRLVIIDATKSPLPALNMLQPATTRSKNTYSDDVTRRLKNQTISNFSYIFSSVGSPLTDKQRVPFTILMRVLFGTRNASLITLLDLLDDPADNLDNSTFKPYVLALDDFVASRFFENEYYSTGFANTRKEIKARLYSILMRPELVAMFTTPTRKLDIFDCIQNKKIVLVNTGRDALGPETSQLVGRFIMSLTLDAAFERTVIPREQWNAAFLIVDEFQDYADEYKTPELLRLAREYNLGVVIAQQQMHDKGYSDSLRNAISTNSSIKYAAAVEGIDLPYVARDLHCDTTFISSQKCVGGLAHFACYVRNLTHQAISLAVPLGNIQAQPQMSSDTHAELIRLNGERLSDRAQPANIAIEAVVQSERAKPTPTDEKRSASDTPEAGSTW